MSGCKVYPLGLMFDPRLRVVVSAATGGVMLWYANLPYITLTLMGNIICERASLSL